MSVGDVNSTAKGSGARYNDGKPDLSLIPLAVLAATIPPPSAPQRAALGHAPPAEQHAARAALLQLGRFQTSRDVRCLDSALSVLAPWWEDGARVFEYGRRKYASWNWAKGMAWSIPLACAARHALKIIRNGEQMDVESGRRHLGHFIANLVMLRTFVESYPEGNDLPDPSLFHPATPKPEEGIP